MHRNIIEVIEKMNLYGSKGSAFVFLIDFDCTQAQVHLIDEAAKNGLIFDIKDEIGDFSNASISSKKVKNLILEADYINFETYQKAFDLVKNELNYGNSFLVNLTAPSNIKMNWTLDQVFNHSKARYKVHLKDFFVCFSPETFIQIDEFGKVISRPMKGTIKEENETAKDIILNDNKELFEHTTIVDLIRNDLSKVCEKVWVERFRYIDTIVTEKKEKILQISSEICGFLPENWQSNLGSIIMELLPAGSISGAPKDKTLEIIKTAEEITYNGEKRGFYTGVFGLFDGKKLSSSVLIRYIEKNDNKLQFKSGGGITTRSDAKTEYEELKTKVYVPVF